jgi:hypothetical protein
MKWQLLKILLIFTLLKITFNQGLCGPNSPKSIDDCLKYSNSTNLCCLITNINGPVNYQQCINIYTDNTFTYSTVGNMQYTINCTGLYDYDRYFPFEQKYKPCGINNPSTSADCAFYSTQNSTCCMAGLDKYFAGNTNCYHYSKNPDVLAVGNFTEINNYGVQLFFSCDSKFLFVNLFLVFIIMLLF